MQREVKEKKIYAIIDLFRQNDCIYKDNILEKY